MTDVSKPGQAGALVDEIEYQINQWYCGDGTLRECAERIYRLAGCGSPISPAKNGDISCEISAILRD